MKKLLPFLLCILLLTGCAATYDGPTEEKTVCSAESSEYYNADGSIQYTTRTEYTYDIYGNCAVVLDYAHTRPGGEMEPRLKAVMEYDQEGHTIRERQYDLSGWFREKIVDVRYTYDEQGRMTSTRHRRDLSWDNTTIVYDDEARTRTTTNGNGTVIVESMNEKDWVIRSESDFGGKHTLEEFDRREDGQILAIRTYVDGVLTSVHEQTYDDQGRMLTWSITEDGVTTVKHRYEYGEDYEKLTYDFGSYYITRYDINGNAVSRTFHDADGTMTSQTIYSYTIIQVPANEEGTS